MDQAIEQLIVGISTAVGGGVVGAILTQLLQAHGRRNELRTARDEKHREDVRAAYADFIGAYSKFLDASLDIWILKSGVDDLRAVGNLPGEKMLADRADALRLFESTSAEARMRTANVAMIDDDDERRNTVLDFQPATAGLLRDTGAFQAVTAQQRDRLQSFTESIAGAFSPDRWHAELEARRAKAPVKPKGTARTST